MIIVHENKKLSVNIIVNDDYNHDLNPNLIINDGIIINMQGVFYS